MAAALPVSLDNLVTTTPSRFTVIQPSLLPPMAVLESIDTDTIVAARMAQLVIIWNNNDPPNAAQYDVGNLEFDPLKIQAELAAYFELLVRDRVNQAARAVTLAFAVGSDLDAIATRYPYGVPRLTQAAGTWNGPGTQEPDSAYRQRIWLSPNILSLNGPGQACYGSYTFWALSAPLFQGDPPLKHASELTNPGTGNVYIPIMSASVINTLWTMSLVDEKTYTNIPGAQPIPTATQIGAVYEYITDPGFARQGLTDVVSVIAPKVVNTTIQVQVWIFPGIDKTAIMAQVTTAVSTMINALQWLGADLTLLALNGALGQPGVYRTNIISPATDVVVGIGGCVNVTSCTIVYEGTGE